LNVNTITGKTIVMKMINQIYNICSVLRLSKLISFYL
jgi:hypothetical protein